MAVTTRTLRLQHDLEAAVRKITDTHTRAMTAAWVDAWDEIAPDLLNTLVDIASTVAAGKPIPRALLLRSERLKAVLIQVSDQLATLTKTAGVTVTSDLRGMVLAAGAAQAAILDSQLPDGVDLVDVTKTLADPAVDAIVKRSTEQITSRLKPVAPETYQVIRRELIRGQAAGTSPGDTAARMVQRAENRFNFSLSRAMVIARTEALDAHRTAAAESQALHTEVLAGWVWLAKLDADTCPSCWGQHGRLHQLDEPGPLDHQQGRCARMPKTKTWAMLGLPNIGEPADVTPDAAASFDALTPAEQLAVLGADRHAAWTAGHMPMETWSQRRTTAGWRDSYTAAAAPLDYKRSGGRSSTVKSRVGRRSPNAA